MNTECSSSLRNIVWTVTSITIDFWTGCSMDGMVVCLASNLLRWMELGLFSWLKQALEHWLPHSLVPQFWAYVHRGHRADAKTDERWPPEEHVGEWQAIFSAWIACNITCCCVWVCYCFHLNNGVSLKVLMDQLFENVTFNSTQKERKSREDNQWPLQPNGTQQAWYQPPWRELVAVYAFMAVFICSLSPYGTSTQSFKQSCWVYKSAFPIGRFEPVSLEKLA